MRLQMTDLETKTVIDNCFLILCIFHSGLRCDKATERKGSDENPACSDETENCSLR